MPFGWFSKGKKEAEDAERAERERELDAAAQTQPEFIRPNFEKKIASLSPQGRAQVAREAKRIAGSDLTLKVSPNNLMRYVDGVVRGEQRTYVVKKCNIDWETADKIDRVIEKQADKQLF